MMLPAIAGALFGLAPLAMVLAPRAAAQLQWPTLPNNLTDDVLRVAGSISDTCVNTTYCQTLVTTVIPRCQELRGDPGCWCGNHDPLHFCAICISSPADNRTSADQMQTAGAAHGAFHAACSAYEALINGTTTVTTSSVESSTSATVVASATAVAATQNDNKVPIGPLVGGVVGGVIGLALVAGGIWLIGLWIKNKNKNGNHDIAPSSVSYMGSEHKSPMGYAAPYPHNTMAYNSGHVSPLPQAGYHSNPEPMNPGGPMSSGHHQGV